MALEMAIKIVNNTTSLNNLILSLLVFEVYTHMHSIDPLASSIR